MADIASYEAIASELAEAAERLEENERWEGARVFRQVSREHRIHAMRLRAKLASLATTYTPFFRRGHSAE